MGDENPIRTLGDYSKPSHKGYRNTIKLLVGNNVIALRSDTIRLVQNGRSFHGLRSEDPNQHLKDFLKLVDSLDLDGENRERTRLRLFQFSLRDQASNWLERLPVGSITTWEDLTTRFLTQFFPPRRTVKLRNDILMFQQHHEESLSEAWTHGGKLRDLNAEESWALLEDLALYDNESLNDPRDFAKPVKAIALPQDVPSTSDCRLIKLENQVQRLIEAHLAPTQPTQVNKITTSCEICSGPHYTQYYMDDYEQPCVDYASSRANEMGGKKFTPNQGPRTFNDAANTWKEKPNFNWAHSQTFTSPQNGSISVHSSSYQMKLEKALLDFDSYQEKRNQKPVKVVLPKYLSPASIKELNKNPLAPKRVHFVNSIVILNKDNDTEEDVSTTDACRRDLDKMTRGNKEVKEQGEEEEDEDDENFNLFPTMQELSHHEWLLKNPRSPWVKARIRTGSLNNIKISCMIGHFFKKHAYIDLELPINIMSRRQYNQIMNYGLRSRQKPSNPDKISNFVGRVKSIKIFIRSFAYECDFMIMEDTTSIIDRCLG
ncbi:MAK10-like protein [Tanacetum coccineum]